MGETNEAASAARLDAETMARVDEIDGARTPGRWYWAGSERSRDVCLVAKEHRRPVVMAFARWGMRGAQPLFAVIEAGGRVLRGVDGLSRPDGIKPLDNADTGLAARHPDARFIAEASWIVPFLRERVRALEAAVGVPPGADARSIALARIEREVNPRAFILRIAESVEEAATEARRAAEDALHVAADDPTLLERFAGLMGSAWGAASKAREVIRDWPAPKPGMEE